MIDFIYNGVSYTLVKNKKLFNCYNVLFMGYFYIGNITYKKYQSANKKIYLVEV